MIEKGRTGRDREGEEGRSREAGRKRGREGKRQRGGERRDGEIEGGEVERSRRNEIR